MLEFDENYIKRFWEKVDIKGEDECWEWKNYKSPDGYGRTRYPNQGNFTLASRIAYIITFGFIEEGMRILHKCDNRSCCNPSHLFVGTQTENIYDMENKGRSNHISERIKIPKSIVLEIRIKYSERNKTQQELADEYGFCLQAIRNMVTGKTYKKVGGPILSHNAGYNQYTYKNKENNNGKPIDFNTNPSI